MNRLIAFGIVGLVTLLIPLSVSAQVGEQETPVVTPQLAASAIVLEPTRISEPLFLPAEKFPAAIPTKTMTWPETWEQQGVDVTAAATVQRCFRYRVLIDRWNPDFGLDPALVLAVMAQESACYPYEGGASVGLMQVTPAKWTTTRERLLEPSVNVYWGMYILYLTLNDDVNNPDHDTRRALAAYNCGWESLDAGKCFDFGGYAYADRVLDFWLPYVLEAMK